MKIIVNSLVILSLICIINGQFSPGGSVRFGQVLNVTTNSTTYSFASNIFGNAPSLTVSSSSAIAGTSTVVVNQVTVLPNVSVNAGGALTLFNLPTGYAAISITALQQGFSFNFSADLSGSANLNASFKVPSVAFSGGSGIGSTTNISNLVVLSFDAVTQSYAEIPPQYYRINSDGSLSLTLTQSITILFATRNASINIVRIVNNVINAFYLAANTSTNFVVMENNNAAVYINNLTAASGAFYISASANANAETASITASGRVLVSNIYNFTHSAGSRAVYNAQLVYNLSASTLSEVNANAAAWYRYDTAATPQVWVQFTSSVSGNSGNGNLVVSTSTSSFSDWSVQYSNNTASASSSPNPNTGNIGTSTGYYNTGAAGHLQIPFVLSKISSLFF